MYIRRRPCLLQAPMQSRAGIFSHFRNSDRLAGTFHWSEDASTAWLVPSSTAKDPPLPESRFLQNK